MRSSNKLPTPSLPSTDWFLNLKPILPSFSLPNDETLNCLPSTSNNQLPKKTQDHQENHRNLTNSSILLFSNGKSIERSKFIGTNGNSVMLTPPHTPEDGLKVGVNDLCV
ncbi:unnamed protein product, partial [Mesorhabditis belari]|uniref:Uncharacterized protein n=1 Tax=Mesorhabditis belari TaxID=2138241 RepID=A0AAF3FAN3_9BILA